MLPDVGNNLIWADPFLFSLYHSPPFFFAKNSTSPTTNHTRSSQPRINLINSITTRPRIPSVARLAISIRHRAHLIRAHEQIHVQATRQMPCNMAVERPDTRIIVIDLHDQIAVRPYDVRVASNRVIQIRNGAIPDAAALGQDPGVVAMDVHRMRCV
jgi:hypothetical protein